MDKITQLLNQAFDNKTLIKIIISNKKKKSTEFTKVSIRPIILGGKEIFQFEYTFPKKVTHENLSSNKAIEVCYNLLDIHFKQMNIYTEAEEIQVLASKVSNPKITVKTLSVQAPKAKSKEHNKKKNYLIDDKVPCDFLIRLGVMDNDGTVFQKHYSKFRQINRYLEIVDDVFPYLPNNKRLKIIDFGCGKAYLTFALYYYLRILKNRDVEIIGLDLKEDVIDFCNSVAKDLSYDELTFLKGDIADYTDDHADMVVTLHACDTATDYALINAVKWNTKVILSVPCCQHELFKQINNSVHQPMLKHGILKDRLTEYLTDGLRGLKLETKGYDVAMIEFTTLEHTAKNIMIKAVKSNSVGPYQRAKQEKAQEEFDALCQFYQVKPTISKL